MSKLDVDQAKIKIFTDGISFSLAVLMISLFLLLFGITKPSAVVYLYLLILIVLSVVAVMYFYRKVKLLMLSLD